MKGEAGGTLDRARVVELDDRGALVLLEPEVARDHQEPTAQRDRSPSKRRAVNRTLQKGPQPLVVKLKAFRIDVDGE